ncbi:MAG: ferredoxin-thioredoxin reductase catalytic domain-containing protein [Patescibacteria group bacterium]|jgi:ferredoxin-thioredoxin reductase catalytic subunit
MTKDELKKVWDRFTQNKDFILNPDPDHVEEVATGLIVMEQKYGLRLCPCRLRDGSRKRDLELMCPCNFKAQDIWQSQGRCWCGLFVKKDN